MAEYIDIDMPMKVWREWGNSYKTISTTLREFLDINKISYKVADVVPVRHGRWLSVEMGSEKVIAMDNNGCPVDLCRCSECGDWLTASGEYSVRGRYCPNCGCAMEDI